DVLVALGQLRQRIERGEGRGVEPEGESHSTRSKNEPARSATSRPLSPERPIAEGAKTGEARHVEPKRQTERSERSNKPGPAAGTDGARKARPAPAADAIV